MLVCNEILIRFLCITIRKNTLVLIKIRRGRPHDKLVQMIQIKDLYGHINVKNHQIINYTNVYYMYVVKLYLIQMF